MQGRRTSINTGGRLEQPELEMISPVMPAWSGNAHKVKTYTDGAYDEAVLTIDGTAPMLIPASIENSSESKNAIREQKTTETIRSKNKMKVSHNDGTIHLPCTQPIIGETHHRKSALYLSQIYRKECLSSGGLNVSGEDVMVLATNIPLPETPVKRTSSTKSVVQSKIPTPTSVKSIRKSPGQSLPSAPRAKTSPRRLPLNVESTDVSRLDDISNEAHIKNEDGVSLTSDVTIRRFPSVTVVDDRKGQWRSVSFISVPPKDRAAIGSSRLE